MEGGLLGESVRCLIISAPFFGGSVLFCSALFCSAMSTLYLGEQGQVEWKERETAKEIGRGGRGGKVKREDLDNCSGILCT